MEEYGPKPNVPEPDSGAGADLGVGSDPEAPKSPLSSSASPLAAPPALAPPTTPGAIPAKRRPSAWPDVIGIIAIVIGALGMLSGLLMILQALFADWMTSNAWANASDAEAMREITARWMPWNLTISIVRFGNAILLVVLGAALMKRRPVVARLIVIYCIVQIIAGVAGGITTGLVHSEVRAQTTQAQAMRAGATWTLFFGGPGAACFSILWSVAFPVFLIIWFGRASVRSEARGWN